ncbi:MAG: hypothetical protein HYS13_13190, partial [Planctomycetia bacterium]|nr:hypothetical protein [Planctomycetia bacterium]
LEERARCQAEERRLAEMLDALAGTAGGADSAEAPGAGAACEPEPREVPSAEAGMPDAAEVVAAAESEPATDELAHSSVVSPDTPGLAGAGSEDVESEELRRQIREAFGLPLEAVEPADGGELDEAGAGALDAPPAMDEGTGLPAEGPPEPLAATAEEGVRWKSLGDAPEATTSGAATGAAAVHEPPLEGEGHDESIESYMSRLLERVRTSQDDNAAKAGSGETRAAEARPAAETPPTPAPVPPDAERYRPRATAPEMSADIAAMRDLANKNARQAIDTHAKGRLKAQARMKLGLTVVMLLAAVGVTWFLGSMGTAAYLVAVGCLIGAVIFGVQYLVLVSKITAREEEEEEEQAAKPPAPTGGSVESPAAKSPGGAQAPPVEA